MSQLQGLVVDGGGSVRLAVSGGWELALRQDF